MKIGHRKASGFSDWLINAFTGRGGFAHTELVFDDGTSFTSTSHFDHETLVYPTPNDMVCRNRKGGPLLRRISMPAHLWEFTELEFDETQKLQCYQWAIACINESIKANAGYDWFGVYRFAFPWIKEHPEDWFCTEAVITCLKEAGMFPGMKPWKKNPNNFWKTCQRSK